MKPIKIILTVIAFVWTGTFFNSCQKETEPIPANNPGNKILKEGLPECNVACLDEGPYYQYAESFIRQWSPLSNFPGYYRNNKSFKTRTWNDQENFYIEIASAGFYYDQQKLSGQWELIGPVDTVYSFSTVIITLNGANENISMDDPATFYTYIFPLPEGWSKCDPMIYSVKLLGDGQPVWLGSSGGQENLTYNLYSDCLESFTGETVCDFGLRFAYFNFMPDANYTFIMIEGSLIEVMPLFTPTVIITNNPAGSLLTVQQGTVTGSEYFMVVSGGPVFAGLPLTISVLWSSIDPGPYITGTWTVKDEDGNQLGIVAPMMCMQSL